MADRGARQRALRSILHSTVKVALQVCEGGAPDAGGEGFDMSAPLCTVRKAGRSPALRANKAKREAIAAAAILAE